MLSYDPDTWLLRLRTPDAIKKWLTTEKDYLSDYLPPILLARGTGPKAMADAIKDMGALLELMPDDTLRGIYYDNIGEYWPAFKKNYKLTKREKIDLPKLEKLKKDERADFFDFGFFEKSGAYWTMDRNKEVRICNFVVKILFFVRSENEPKYVCLFENMFGRKRVTAITTDDFTTVGTFRKVIGKLGNFIFEGGDAHLNKIKMKLFFGVPEADEPRYMGHNPGGFYTWANGLFFEGEFYKSNKYGIVQLRHVVDSLENFKELPPESHLIIGDDEHVIESAEKFLEANAEASVSAYIDQKKVHHLSFYFLPFSTKLKITEHDDDDFEFERKFKYYETKKDVSFVTWSKLMRAVYGDNGMVGVAYYLMSLFRDIVYKANNNYIPLLGFFGPRGSGKSTAARSLNRMFGDGLEDGVNLESGSTATGIRRYMASMQNAILWLNEYKNSLPDYTLGMIKGIADGSGKLTGRNTGGNETKNYRPRCTVVFCGQDLPTKDPAILSRSIICEFDSKDRNRTKLDELMAMETTGVGTVITCALLTHRQRVKDFYHELEPHVTKYIRKKCKERNIDADDRLVLNITSLLTVTMIVAEPQPEVESELTAEGMTEQVLLADETDYKHQLGFSIKHLGDILIGKLKLQVDIQHTSDDVEQYFQVLMAMVERGIVKEGHHYKISKETDGARLYLRVGTIHAMYRQFAGQAGYAVMDVGTLKSYLMKHKCFVAYKDNGVKFEHEQNKTSAMVLNYDLLRSYDIQLRMNMEYEKKLDENNELMK